MAKAVFATKIDPGYDDLPEHRYHFPKAYLRAVEEARGDWIVYYEPRRSSGALSSRGGQQSYFATARVVRIEPDQHLGDHFYAYHVNRHPHLGGRSDRKKKSTTDARKFNHLSACICVHLRSKNLALQGTTVCAVAQSHHFLPSRCGRSPLANSVEDFLSFHRPVRFKEGEHYYESGLRRDHGGTSKDAFGRFVRGISEGEYNTILRAGFANVIGEDQPGREPAAFGFADEPATFERPIVERVTADALQRTMS